MKPLRVGVIGLHMGEHHIMGYQKHPQAHVAAICDINPQRLAKIADQYQVTGRYTSAEEMMVREELDIVSVATPNKFHKPQTIMALEKGCHVLCEKPMALNAAEAEEMLAVARRVDCRIMIDFSWRFTPASWALKQFVDSGELGEAYFGRTVWHRRRGIPTYRDFKRGQKASEGGGPMVDLGVHRIDLALWFMGFPKPAWVMGGAYQPIGAAMAKREGWVYDVEDMASGFVRFENGATLVVESSWAANIAENELMVTQILGTKAGIVQRNINEGYEFEAQIYFERDGVQYDMQPHPGLAGTAPNAMVHFVDAILNDKPHLAPGEEGLLVSKILDAIYKSAETGEPVRL